MQAAEQQQRRRRRLRVDVDTALGDETFSALKNSLPFIRAFALRWVSERPNDRLWLTLPDAGSAAMLKRDWSQDPTLRQVHLTAVDSVCDDWRRATPDTRPRLVAVAAPAATEAETLLELAQAIVPLKREEEEEEEAEAPPDAVHDGDAAASLLILNGNLVDMGATGLGLSARRLRQELLDTLLPVYYLRTTPWGVIFRQYPLRWSVWVDQPGHGGEPFRLVTDALEEMPTAEELERLLAGERSGSGSTEVAAERGPPWASMFRALSRFLDAYRRG